MEKETGLTGCYLLIVLAEPICESHKEKILQRVAKGFLSWNTIETECDLKEIESAIQTVRKSNGYISGYIYANRWWLYSDSFVLEFHSTSRKIRRYNGLKIELKKI